MKQGMRWSLGVVLADSCLAAVHAPAPAADDARVVAWLGRVPPPRARASYAALQAGLGVLGGLA
jgi:hypothetical protein